jgi:hypothetical protein
MLIVLIAIAFGAELTRTTSAALPSLIPLAFAGALHRSAPARSSPLLRGPGR